jgi:hypothetical protein
MQCCGDPIEVDKDVSLTVSSAVDHDFLVPILGSDEAGRITGSEDHHGGYPDDTVPTQGRVLRIAAAYCRFAPPPGDPHGMAYPLEGSGTTELRDVATGWEPTIEGLRFVGYTVDLRVSQQPLNINQSRRRERPATGQP